MCRGRGSVYACACAYVSACTFMCLYVRVLLCVHECVYMNGHASSINDVATTYTHKLEGLNVMSLLSNEHKRGDRCCDDIYKLDDEDLAELEARINNSYVLDSIDMDIPLEKWIRDNLCYFDRRWYFAPCGLDKMLKTKSNFHQSNILAFKKWLDDRDINFN